jgi:hypothetical protein
VAQGRGEGCDRLRCAERVSGVLREENRVALAVRAQQVAVRADELPEALLAQPLVAGYAQPRMGVDLLHPRVRGAGSRRRLWMPPMESRATIGLACTLGDVECDGMAERSKSETRTSGVIQSS